ncbi:GDSL esterase/lipase At5g18430-like isoform X2 [Punica granatum]|uniref:GDSL esterase/lipase At5g18430-like isoform X2 n=1 Tax=Punica granatum TaxID=22663 RepID=A0A6P8C846_PUNGR|nr:GDSL esterase/lipase At5g18430-like isoform X2 [Punica granatum]
MASSWLTPTRWLLVIFCLALSRRDLGPHAVEAARAFFVFGDSLVDNGNNNYLATTARADSPPYGIDYPTHMPTGRFSNGFNIPDFISQSLGSEPTLPYLSPELRGQTLLVGANFASAGIGILNDTGVQFVNIIRMYRQYEYFKEYQRRVSALIGQQRTKRLVNQALVLITVGGNDFVNNYYLVPFSARSRQYALPDYVKFLISEYRKLLMFLISAEIVRSWGAEGPSDGHWAVGLRPSRAGHARWQERPMCPRTSTGCNALQSAAHSDVEATQQRVPLGCLHRGQYPVNERRLHQQSSSIRFRHVQGSVLWPRTL